MYNYFKIKAIRLMLTWVVISFKPHHADVAPVSNFIKKHAMIL